MLSRSAQIFVFLLLAFCMLSANIYAAAGEWQANAQIQVRLISGVTATGGLAQVPLALEAKLADGWKTYWRSPGDAGAPPQFDWPADANPNLAQTELQFPVPERHMMSGLETIGYGGHVVFPLTITPKQIGAALPLQARLTILTCAELCIPNDFTLKLEIPAGEATPSAEAGLINAALAQVPQKATLRIDTIEQSADGTATLTFTAPAPLEKPEAFIESAAGSLFQPPEIIVSDKDKQRGTMRLTPFAKQPRSVPTPLTVTLVESGRGWENSAILPAVAAPLTATAIPATDIVAPPAPTSIWLMLWFAFLGGLILNLMPCVLPVLSLKVLKFMGHGGRDNLMASRSFLLTAAGIVASFLLIAGVLLGIRAAGHSVGWGIQFQHPAFLLFLMTIVVLFAANLWGLFEISLPDALAQRLAQGGRQRKNLGDFLSGAFAALLATPCTAPFLGTAIGFALGSDTLTVLAIFTGMGLGMALPYVLVATVPSLATKMPRPGRWMQHLRKFLALALLATALWLGYVLWLQTQPIQTDQRWQPFTPQRIAEEVAAGKTVFVDVTAAWCITCQTNKKLVIYREPVAGRLFNGNIIVMQADWTKPDQGIADYLKSFNRAGIPFNVVYGPAAPQGIILPELLTADSVINALDKAKNQ